MNIHINPTPDAPRATAYLVAIIERATKHVVHMSIYSEPEPTTSTAHETFVLLKCEAPTYPAAHAEVNRVIDAVWKHGGKA